MKIALNVSYVLDVEDRNDFYNIGNGSLRKDILEKLFDIFSEEITLSENVKGTRNSGIECVPIYENKNCVKCDCCGKYLSISKDLYLGLDYPTEVNGKKICNSCEWELRPLKSAT